MDADRSCNRVYSGWIWSDWCCNGSFNEQHYSFTYFFTHIWCGTATNLQARYAGTDLADKKQRATAVSITMVMTTFGAVAGPNLVGVMGSFAHSIGVPKLAGPFILSAAAFILAGLVLLLCFVQIR